MTETLSKAREEISKAIQARVIEIMDKVVRLSAREISEHVLDECDNPLNEGALNDSIADRLGSWDFSGEINLATCEVQADGA